MELYSGKKPQSQPSDEEILRAAPFERVREHSRAKAEEQRKFQQEEARAAAERQLLEWKER